MKFVTYTSTPGLTQFPESQRLFVYRSTHKRLMRDDHQYRKRVRRFRLEVLGTTVVFGTLTCMNPPDGGTALALSVAGYILLILVYVAYILCSSFTLQNFQNSKVGEALQEHVPS